MPSPSASPRIFSVFTHKLIIIFFVIGISVLHLLLPHDMEKMHLIALELYFLPIILSGFWFGLRGAMITSLAITLFYLTYSVTYWGGFSAKDLNRVLELAIFNVIAFIVGWLQDRQKARAREKLDSIKAMAATVAHEMNSPLFVAMGTLELLQDDFAQESEPYQEIQHTMKNLHKLKILIKKISQLENVVTREYDGTSTIVDFEKSSSSSFQP